VHSGEERVQDDALRSAILDAIRLMYGRRLAMIQHSDDGKPAGYVAGAEPTKRLRRRDSATVDDIRAAIGRIKEQE
jgi:hypothetical protein